MEYSILKNLHVPFPYFTQMPLLMIKSSVSLFSINFHMFSTKKMPRSYISYMVALHPFVFVHSIGKRKQLVGALMVVGDNLLVLAFLTLVWYF